MLENPMVAGYGYQETLREPKKVGKCNYKYCNEELYEGEGYEFNDQPFCSTMCIGEHLVEENAAVDLSA